MVNETLRNELVSLITEIDNLKGVPVEEIYNFIVSRNDLQEQDE